MLESFHIFDDFSRFLDKLCEVSQSSIVEYQSDNIDNKKLVFLDQLCHNFFSEVLLGHF